jgi:hypothetical protein
MPGLAFTPGKKGNLKRMIDYQAYVSNNIFRQIVFLDQAQAIAAPSDDTIFSLCQCFRDKANIKQNAYNDATQTTNMRVSRAITGTLGGRIHFGNGYLKKAKFIEQPFSVIKPLRNTF